MFHGNGVLDKAIDQLHEDDEDFRNYNKRTAYNQGSVYMQIKRNS